jgi:hypothetical protein
MDLLSSVEVDPPGRRFVSNLQVVLLSKETQSLHVRGHCGYLRRNFDRIDGVEARCDLQSKG